MNPDRSLPRAVRQAMPQARDVAIEVAKQHGVCIRPVPLRRTDTRTGASEIIDVPCGATLEAVCEPCARRNRQLRMAQCREGWHLEDEPAITPDPPSEAQRWLVEFRADVQAQRDHAPTTGRTPPIWTRPSPGSTPRSTKPGCAATFSAVPRASATARPGADRTPLTCPSGRWRPPPSAGPSPAPAARPTGPRCSAP
ncbi:replication initiator [Spongiactinospora sp. TRM90649]|uniref:replication initiator n=1 Tax=Spongiactinospora sp. TRM90649 TaxID=3031114 RepID=UPI003211A4FD